MSDWEDRLEQYDNDDEAEARDKALDELLETDEELSKLTDEVGKALAEYLDGLEVSDNSKASEDTIDVYEAALRKATGGFHSSEERKAFFEALHKEKDGVYVLNPQKIKKAKILKKQLGAIFDENVEISIGNPNIETNFICVNARGKYLTVNNPQQLWKIAAEEVHSVDVMENLDDTVGVSFGINDVTLKIGE